MTITTITKSYEEHEAEIKALKEHADREWDYYDRASRQISANDHECSVLWADWRKAQDAYELALRAKEERRKAFLKLLRG